MKDKLYTMYEAAEMLGKDYGKIYYVCIRNGIGSQGFREWSLTKVELEKIAEIFEEREANRRRK